MIRIIGIATALVLVTASSFSADAGDRRGYVQQSTSTVKPAGLYGVGQLAQRSYEHNRANDRLRSAGPATRNGCYDNDPNTPCLDSMIADSATRHVQGGNALDKPTFGEKFKMSPNAAYEAGPGNVGKYKGVPTFVPGADYVPPILTSPGRQRH